MLSVISIILCIDHIELINSGYTSNPASSRAAFESQTIGKVGFYEETLRSKYPAEAELPNGPIDAILPEFPCTLEKREIVAVWHTPLTHLYLARRVPAHVWYPGGKVGDSYGRLEVRGDQ